MPDTLPNIVVICIDALRYDCISAEQEKPLLEKYGVAGTVKTPTIDRLAKSGVRFRQAISAAIHTPPSLTSIFTGLYPPHNGVQAFFKTQLLPEITTVAELLSKVGYHCIHATEFPYIRLLSLERGVHQSYSSDDEKIFDHIKNIQRPVYLFLHFFDVHDPYLCSPSMGFEYNRDYRDNFTTLTQKFNIPLQDEPFPYIRTFQTLIKTLSEKGELSIIFSLYIHGVNKFDQGRFSAYLAKLKNIGLLDNCLLFLFSDHGEGPGKDTFGHGNELYDGMIRTPLIVSYPGIIPKGKISDLQVRLIDIVPTILDILQRQGINISLPYLLDGKSLLPIIEGSETEHRTAFSEVWFHTLSPLDMKEFLDRCLEKQQLLTPRYDTYLHQRSLRCPPWKIILEGREVDNIDISLSRSDDKFIHALFTSLFHKLPTQEEVNKYKKISRTSLLNEFIKQKEFSLKNALFNISVDSIEQNNYLSTHLDSEILHIFFNLKTIADQIFISGKKQSPVPITYGTSKEQETIESRLRSLGYL